MLFGGYIYYTASFAAGFLWLLGWIVSLIIPAAPLFCGLGLGLSVVLRKKGKRKGSFIIQFMGLAGIVLSMVLFFTCYGNLLRYID